MPLQCIPSQLLTQKYIPMHLLMHPFPTMYSRVHYAAFMDASLPNHILKGTFQCIQGCIPSQPCIPCYVLHTLKDASLPYHIFKGTFLCIQGCIPSLSCTQGYIPVHSRMHLFPITSSRLYIDAFHVAFCNHVLKCSILCIQGDKDTYVYVPGYIHPRQYA
jgi:hypothetical protein